MSSHREADDVAQDLAAVVETLPSGEARAGQREMAMSIARSLGAGKNLIVGAGTGTGKTLAYLVALVGNGSKTVITTATKALQDQLADQDLPRVAEVIDQNLDWAVLKGRSNYICRQRLHEIATSEDQLSLEGLEDSDVRQEIATLTAWADQTEQGDRAELSVEPSPAAWSAVSVGPRECPGRAKCPSGESCFAELAREHADSADIVIVNHHLYGLDVANDGAILPEHDIVVIDEVHGFYDTVVRASGFEIGLGRCLSLARAAGSVLADSETQISAVGDAASQLADVLAAWRGKRVDPAERSIAAALVILRQACERIDALAAKIPRDAPLDTASKAQRLRQASAALMIDIDAVTLAAADEVAWVPFGTGPASLHVAPVEIAGLLRENLWSKHRAVLTSATIPPRLVQTLGLDTDTTEEIDVGSPFDYATNALLYCATDLPDPRDEDYAEATVRELEVLIAAAEGRTLALFTSYRAMRAAHEYLDPRLPWPTLSQDQAPKPALIDAFLKDEHTSLFATMGFWQGVDLPGSTLSLVVIDRIPFPRPDDPLLSAQRDKAGSNAFAEIDVPRAAMLLAQGAGRLIRSQTDRGVVAVLDRRLARARSYRWQLINALPPMKRTSEREEALEFLRSCVPAVGG
ncbi:MAG: ATP-dependent DNA helicase [Acidobacteria bacterium]|nr:ATP-dependent DNA helicase [Acidobacteriota bacterium]